MPYGIQIVLTASRAEMSQFGPEVGAPADGFVAFCCTFPRLYANPIVRKYFTSIDEPDGTVRFAPYSLRKIEAALIGRYAPDRMTVCHPDHLREFVGDRTRIVGITTMDPLRWASGTSRSRITP